MNFTTRTAESKIAYFFLFIYFEKGRFLLRINLCFSYLVLLAIFVLLGKPCTFAKYRSDPYFKIVNLQVLQELCILNQFVRSLSGSNLVPAFGLRII